jgi:transposase
MSLKAAAREFGVDPRTVKKMVEHPVPPGYRLTEPRKRPKMDGYLERIEEILAEDQGAPKKQRHTAQRIFERLRDEDGYRGGPCQVRRAVKCYREGRPKEGFVPLVSVPGEAECDFGEAWVEIAGLRQKAHGFHMTLPYSGVSLLQMYPGENAESFCDGHDRSFKFFGGVPRRIVYDNPAYAVKITGKLTGRERDLAESFGELRSRGLFEAAFCNPRSGNEKGSVERKVGVLRSKWLVPVPKAHSWDELNQTLLEKGMAEKQARAESFAREAEHFLPLFEYDPSRLAGGQADKLSLVRFERNDYSVPTKFVLRKVLIRATPFEVKILSERDLVAVHARSYEKGRAFAKLEHYIDLLEKKPRAAKCALPVLQAGLPDAFEAYRRWVEDGTGHGDRRFVGVLRPATEFQTKRVARALELARACGAKDPADIRLLMLKDVEEPSPRGGMDWKHPGGTRAPRVERPPLSEYERLLSGAAR